MNARSVGIIGGGPAGLSAALWLGNLGFDPWLAEATDRLGGMQNLNFLGNEWVLGQHGLTGPALAQRFVEHVERGSTRLWLETSAARIERAGNGFCVAFGDGRTATAQALLIATGTRYRGSEVLADVPGAATLRPDQLVYGPWAFAALEALQARRVLIVGGGDNAFENARLLAGRAASVDLVMRASSRAQAALQADVAALENCRIHAHTYVLALRAGADGIEAELSDGQCRIVDRVHVLAGYAPNTTALAALFGPLATGFCFDAAGYLQVDEAGRTGVPGVYAAGDVCNPEFPSVVAALAQGARAAKAIERDLRQPL